MRLSLYTFAALCLISCTATQIDSFEPSETLEISAEKESWVSVTKASEDLAFAKDIPWKEGDKVLLLASDQSFEGCTTEETWEGGGRVSTVRPYKKTICSVTKVEGLKCTLIPETPLEEGVYRAFYPVYDYLWYDRVHLSFLYEDWKELDSKHQDMVVSDPVTYKGGKKLKFVMKHICALIDIDIYPPKTGKYSYLKLFAQSPVFAGKADIYLDKKYNVNEFASGWLNYTTLRGDGNSMREGEVFQTSTGLLPVQYEGMSMCIHLVYNDGTHYVSAPFSMPSLHFGEENKLVVEDFQETDLPMQGLWGDYYGDSSPSPYDVN